VVALGLVVAVVWVVALGLVVAVVLVVALGLRVGIRRDWDWSAPRFPDRLVCG
jgi:hypothetical protein